jgi:NlpC/P60 family
MTNYAPVTAHQITEDLALRLLVLDSECVWQDEQGRWWRTLDAAYGRKVNKWENEVLLDPKVDLWEGELPPHPGSAEDFYIENDGYQGKTVYKRERNWAHEQQTSKRHVKKAKNGIIDADPLNASYDGGETWEAVPSFIDVDLDAIDPFFDENWDGDEEAYWAEYNEGAVDAEVISVTEPEVTEFVATDYVEIDPTPQEFFEHEPDYEHPNEKSGRFWGQVGAIATGDVDPIQDIVTLMNARLNEPFERLGTQLQEVQAQVGGLIGQKRTQRWENLVLLVGVGLVVCVAWARVINPIISWVAAPENQNQELINSVSSKAQEIAELAVSRKGVEFNPGTPAQCAFFVRDVYSSAGIELGTTKDTKTSGDPRAGTLMKGMAGSFFGNDIGQIITDPKLLLPGDIVGLRNTYGNFGAMAITHVGIYTGDGMMVDRPTKSAPVQHRPITDFDLTGFIAVRPYQLTKLYEQQTP